MASLTRSRRAPRRIRLCLTALIGVAIALDGGRAAELQGPPAARADRSFDGREHDGRRRSDGRSSRARRLTLRGNFAGLKGAATVARLHQGAVMGVRGPAIADVTVPAATSGTFTAEVTLTAAQVEGLRQGHVYLQIHSETAPDGNLWGWLVAMSARSPRARRSRRCGAGRRGAPRMLRRGRSPKRRRPPAARRISRTAPAVISRICAARTKRGRSSAPTSCAPGAAAPRRSSSRS